ncbi:TolB family protein [Cohnella mopanensis]|uniref:TolB family protein n=1 Tax=Cohnella mopanensis TaxID=2911966 RepID=UPI001EF830D8|nr:hypothetical protein [Cohnella mopanensis]
MTRRFFVAACLIGAVLLTSCSKAESTKQAHSQAETETSMEVGTETSTAGVGSVNDYWDGVGKQGLLMSPFVDPEPPMEYIRLGLKHDNPDIRWFCAYKILKYASQLDQQDRDVLEQLTKDESNNVRKAATFVKSILQETFEDDRIIHSPVNNQIAFHLYHESQFNDGELWVAQDGKPERLTKLDGSITKLAYSPDGNKISAEYGGRIWGALAIVDVNSGNRILPDIIGAIIADPANGYDVDPQKVDRFDPYLQIIEWSPDSTRLLVSYAFSSGLDQYDYGWAVYETDLDKVMKVSPSKLPAYDTKPEGFGWDVE